MDSKELIKYASQLAAQRVVTDVLDLLNLPPEGRQAAEAQLLLASVVSIEKILSGKPARSPHRPRGFPGQAEALNNLMARIGSPIAGPPSYRSVIQPVPEAYYGQREGNSNPEGIPPPPYVPRSN